MTKQVIIKCDHCEKELLNYIEHEGTELEPIAIKTHFTAWNRKTMHYCDYGCLQHWIGKMFE